MSKYGNYFVLNYEDKITGKKIAQTCFLGKSVNLIIIYRDFRFIANSEGERAELNVVHLCDNKKHACELSDCWNSNYKKTDLFFGY